VISPPVFWRNGGRGGVGIQKYKSHLRDVEKNGTMPII